MKSGQALVLVMMVLSVALTVGLSIATRSTNEVKVTSSQEESARALEAAEAGLEKALGGTLDGASEANLTGSSATYVVATPAPGIVKEWVYLPQLMEGQAATLDLRNYVNDNAAEKYRFRFCWGKNETSSDPPVLELALYYRQGGIDRVGRVILEPKNPPRITSSLGSPWTLVSCPDGFRRSKMVDLVNFMPDPAMDMSTVQFKMIRIKTWFNGSNAEPVAVVVAGANADFGRQGTDYTSVGSAGTSTQKVRGVELNYDLPMMFDNAVFSGGSLNKI